MKFTNMNELESINVTALVVATIIGSILPFFFVLLYFAIRRGLLMRELRKHTEAAKHANGENVVKLSVEIGHEYFLLHKIIQVKNFSKLSEERQKVSKSFTENQLKNIAEEYRERYKSYTQITINPF